MRDEFKQLCFDAEDFLTDGQFALAIQKYRTAIAKSQNDIEKYLGLTYIGAAYDEADNQRIALSTFKECQNFAEKSFGKNSIQFALALSNEGMVYSNRRKSERAEPLLDQAVQRLTTANQKADYDSLPSAWESVVEVFANTGECKARLGKVDEALALMQNAYIAAKENLPLNNSRRVQASVELGALLACIGQTEEADQIMKEAMNSLQKSMRNPHDALQMLQQTIANTASFLEGIEGAQLKSAAKSTTKDHSSVVPIVPSQNTAADRSCAGYQLKISLNRVTPPVWRRVAVSIGCSLSDLHFTIQKAMGWENDHLHEFRIGRARFGDLRQIGAEVRDERKFSLADLHLTAGSKIEYEYDFGDSWIHTITVERTLNKEEVEASDVFVTGKGACPPEDCGGPYQFMNLLAALKDSNSDNEELPTWLENYDPTSLPSCFKSKSKKKSTGKIKKLSPV